MKLAMMQPYFFPYLGYFSLIKHSDFFILSDNVQYINKGWINRNRILKQNQGFMYINVPLIKHSSTEIIKNIEIDNNVEWQDKILKNLLHYKRKAPFFNDTMNVIKEIFTCKTNSITILNEKALKFVCDYIDIPFNHGIYSELNLKTQSVNAPDEWALKVALELGYDEYINPPGGVEIYDKNKYQKHNLKLTFLKNNLPFYSQRRGENFFENGLSIIDVMMFNSPKTIREMLDDNEFI